MAQEQTTKRVDPKTRRCSPGQAGHLRDKNPEYKYLLANPADDLHGLQMHIDTGWEKVHSSSDKVRVIGGKVDANGTVSFQGQVLIRIPLEEYEARQADIANAMKARENRRNGPGGIDGVTDAQGKLAQNI